MRVTISIVLLIVSAIGTLANEKANAKAIQKWANDVQLMTESYENMQTIMSKLLEFDQIMQRNKINITAFSLTYEAQVFEAEFNNFSKLVNSSEIMDHIENLLETTGLVEFMSSLVSNTDLTQLIEDVDKIFRLNQTILIEQTAQGRKLLEIIRELNSGNFEKAVFQLFQSFGIESYLKPLSKELRKFGSIIWQYIENDAGNSDALMIAFKNYTNIDGFQLSMGLMGWHSAQNACLSSIESSVSVINSTCKGLVTLEKYPQLLEALDQFKKKNVTIESVGQGLREVVKNLADSFGRLLNDILLTDYSNMVKRVTSSLHAWISEAEEQQQEAKASQKRSAEPKALSSSVQHTLMPTCGVVISGVVAIVWALFF